MNESPKYYFIICNVSSVITTNEIEKIIKSLGKKIQDKVYLCKLTRKQKELVCNEIDSLVKTDEDHISNEERVYICEVIDVDIIQR